MTIPRQDAPAVAGSLPLDAATESRIRELVATEQFGVLATATPEQMHTATILFAVTVHWELVFAIRPVTLKARLAARAPGAAFQVDNRSVVATDRTAFVRLEFLGLLTAVGREEPLWPAYHDAFTTKFPFGAALLDQPEIALYVMTPQRLRFAIGAQPPEDVALPPPPEPEATPEPDAER